MSLRREFVLLAQHEPNLAQLCRRFGLSRKTAYKWIKRFREANGDDAALEDRSRRPQKSPTRTPAHIEARVVAVRAAHPTWGARKVRAVLMRPRHDDPAALPSLVPACATVTAILRRHGYLSAPTPRPAAMTRFEAKAPNDLWQMDFKGHFLCHDGVRCFPLTLLDDHSRFALCLMACANEQRETVTTHLIGLFRRYGLPERLLCDNGPPWGSAHRTQGPDARRRVRLTRLSAWLIRLGITVQHGRVRHPQTQGKEERFHRTLGEEVLNQVDRHVACGAVVSDARASLAACQRHFDAWRRVYNEERPHEGIGLLVPLERYRVSPRLYPETLPAVHYDAQDVVRRVDDHGNVRMGGGIYRVGKGLRGEPVALRPSADQDGWWWVYYCHQRVGLIDAREPGATGTVALASPVEV